MDQRLIDDDSLPLARKSVVPGEGFFVPDEVEEHREEREAAEAMTGEDVVVVADPDADGLACVALVRAARGAGALVPAGPHELAEAIDYLTTYAEPDAEIFVCDLCPDGDDDVDGLEDLTERASTVHWFDHHQWDDTLAALVEDAGVDLVVGDSDEECTADVALRSLDADFPAHLAELAAVTRDHDLWIREDSRSDDLADYAHWADAEEYVETVREHGPDLPAEAAEFVAERRVEKEALVKRAVARGQLQEVGEWTVGVTYGRCSQNEVAEAMREQGADASVVVKPAGSVSIRGTDAFDMCHRVAGRLGGGGHPKAAGCKPDIYDDMLDYAHHWTTRGATTKQVVLDAFRDLKAELDAEEGAEYE
ncbi:MAG: DHH family phosphoesterase [Haloarculaceae archaeon]